MCLSMGLRAVYPIWHSASRQACHCPATTTSFLFFSSTSLTTLVLYKYIHLWCAYRLSYSKTESDTTVFVLTNGSLATKITFTNCDDDISVFEQSKTRVSILIHWPAMQEEYAGIKKEERGLVEGLRQPRY